jgi:hypothetical protein
MAVAVIGRPSLFIVRTHARPGVHTLLHSALFVPAITVSPALGAYALALSTRRHSPAEDLKDDDSLSACPAIYQRRVQKEYELRVTVVGEDVFACRIDSQALEISQVDWRAAGPSALHQKPYKLDEAIASQCRALLRYLGLEIAGLDFLVTPEGETVFLEINAAGAWAWVEQATGLPIAAALRGGSL